MNEETHLSGSGTLAFEVFAVENAEMQGDSGPLLIDCLELV